LDTKNMLDFCRKSGHFSGTRKRCEIRVLSDSHSMLLGKSYRMLLQQNQADPNVPASVVTVNDSLSLPLRANDA
jgi:hypothetical protein